MPVGLYNNIFLATSLKHHIVNKSSLYNIMEQANCGDNETSCFLVSGKEETNAAWKIEMEKPSSWPSNSGCVKYTCTVPQNVYTTKSKPSLELDRWVIRCALWFEVLFMGEPETRSYLIKWQKFYMFFSIF